MYHLISNADMTSIRVLDKLRSEHHVIEDLFHRFEHADESVRQRIVREVLSKLEFHSNLEEDFIYPAIRNVIRDKEMVDDAIEEHHIMSLLARDLRQMDARDDRYKAKFRVLTRIVRQHYQDEETRLFPEAMRANVDWSTLGRQVTDSRGPNQTL
jgi:hemerythrin superfamily protein